MAEVNIQFPDGTVKQFEKGVTVEEIAKSISISLAKKAVAGKFDGKLVGYHDALEQDGSIEIITRQRRRLSCSLEYRCSNFKARIT